MLQKFLFVGVGGSGGKTLRFLRRKLRTRLDEAGYTDDLPAGWQFLHIDVPVVADGSHPDLPEQLPPGDYLGLAPKALGYHALDELLQGMGQPVRDHAAPWRPDAKMVGVPPRFGAGQYRAVGRTIAGATLKNVVARLQKCAVRLNHVNVDQELSRVAGVLTGQAGVTPYAPQVIVVTSIAGGSGGGAFLDICDAIRHVLPASKDQIAALLYTPDVFDDLPPASSAGVNANALASIAELLSGYWNNEPPSGPEFAFLQSAGAPVQQFESRGPSMSLLVGRSNGNISFTSQLDVYRASARALTAWTTDHDVQDMVHTTVVGNWTTKAQRTVDRTRLAPGRPSPFSALGYASVGLGRNRFATYSAERLAHHAVERLLRGHAIQITDGETPAAARDRHAQNHLYGYLERCGLRELGPEHNNVIDAVRGGPQSVRIERLAGTRSQMVSATTENMQSLSVHQARTRIMAEISDGWHEAISGEEQADIQRALAWSNDIQTQVIDATAELLGRIGAPVAARVLGLTITELTNEVMPELVGMARHQQHIIATTEQRVSSVFANFDGEILPGNPAIAKAADEGILSFEAEAERHLYELAARLLEDLAKNFLVPLRDAVDRAQQRLVTQDADPDAVQLWSMDAPPKKLEPAENELLLEEVNTYRDHFERLIQLTTGLDRRDEAIRTAVREMITGIADHSDSQVAIGRIDRWTPSQQTLHALDTPSQARFELTIDAEDLLARATDWINRPDTAFGDHVRESLTAYLDDHSVPPAEQLRRLDRFETALKQALATAQPLVEIDAGAYAHFHGPVASTSDLYNLVMSKLPFPTGHPARERVRHIFHWKSESELNAMFDDAPRPRIEMTTFLDAPSQPTVFASLTGPIAGDWATHRNQPGLGGFWQWRRTRPLTNALPVAPIVRRRMIRGWFVARLLNQVSVDDPLHSPVTIVGDDGARLSFPFPLLGPRIREMADVLPAVLESLSIALVDQPQTALEPYHRLEALGNSVGAAPGTTLSVELERWIADGWVAPSAPQPDPGMAGKAVDDRGARADVMLATLTRFIDFFEAYDDAAPSDGTPPPRSWEIREDIVQQLTALRHDIDEAREEADFTVGVG